MPGWRAQRAVLEVARYDVHPAALRAATRHGGRGYGALLVGVGLALIATAAGLARNGPPPHGEWAYTEGAPGGGRYSPLADINRANVASLRPVWTYRHGDVDDGGMLPDYVNKGTAFEATPIVVDGRLIFTTPFNRVIALDPGERPRAVDLRPADRPQPARRQHVHQPRRRLLARPRPGQARARGGSFSARSTRG